MSDKNSNITAPKTFLSHVLAEIFWNYSSSRVSYVLPSFFTFFITTFDINFTAQPFIIIARRNFLGTWRRISEHSVASNNSNNSDQWALFRLFPFRLSEPMKKEKKETHATCLFNCTCK